MNTTNSSETRSNRDGWLQSSLRVLGFIGLIFTLLLLTLWAAAALYFDVRVTWLRVPLAAGYVFALVAGIVLVKGRWLKTGIPAACFVLVLGWWLTLQPSNDRDWETNVAVLPYADINANQVRLHNIRNCDYRTASDFDVQHYDKTYDLDRLRTADLYMVYWGSPHMAHTMISFGFEGGDFLCFSVETRKEKGESYSAIRGLFRQFELVYVAADERDLVRLRTNYREKEDVYLFQLTISPEQIRGLFLDYVRRMNSLRQRPEWYSAIKHNCTTSIRAQRAAADRAPWDWRMLVNGHADTLLYELGVIATSLPLTELKDRAHINSRAQEADTSEKFSQIIRQGLTGSE